MNALVIKRIRERASELPQLTDAIKAIFRGGVTGWGIFTEEFEEGGPIDQLTQEEKEDMEIDSTNNRNEGLCSNKISFTTHSF